MFKKLQKGIRRVDIFGAEVKFNLKNKQKHQSTFGGVVTIILLSAITIIMITNSIALLKREQYTIQSNSVVNMNPPLEQIDAQHFMIGFLVEPSIKLNEKRLTNIYYKQVTQSTYADGTKQKVEGSPIQLEPCTLEHFTYRKEQKNSLENFDDVRLMQTLNTYKCLPVRYQQELQGNYRSDVFKFSKIIIEFCRDSDCYTQAEIDTLLSNKIDNSLQISTIMLNSLVNMRSEDNFQYFTYQDYYIQTTLNQNTYSNTNIYLASENISVDYGYLSGVPDIENQKTYSIEENKLQEIWEDKQGSLTISQFNIRTSQTQNYYNKKFYTFDELISYIGGITKFIMTVIGFFLIKYNNVGLQIKLANYLYQFDIPKKKGDSYVFSFQDLVQQILDSVKQIDDLATKFKAGAQKVLHVQRLANVFKANKTMTTTREIEQIQVNSESNDQYIGLKNDETLHIQTSEQSKIVNLEVSKQTFLKQIIQVLLSSKSKFQYGVKFVISYVLKDIQKKNSNRIIKTKLFDTTLMMIQKDMDILVIMTKLQEVGKLKHVMLSKTQRKLFNCLPKPLVQSNFTGSFNPLESVYAYDYDYESNQDRITMKQRVSLFGNRHDYNTEEKLRKLYEAYEKVQIHEEDNKINQRLGQLLEPTLQTTFKSLSELEKLQNQIREKKHFERQSPLKNTQIVNINEDSDEQSQIKLLSRDRQKPSLILQSIPSHSQQIKSKIDYVDIEIDSQ